MNLNTYDNIKEKLDKTKTWVDIHRKQLLSREILYRPYIALLKRYDLNTSTYSYFIALLDKPSNNHDCKHTDYDSYGRIKLNLNTIWDNVYLNRLLCNANVDIKLVESEEDGDIYFLDV